jgi:hypothetical protein
MSVPVGPQGSLLVALDRVSIGMTRAWVVLTISDLDLDRRVSLGDILDTPKHLRHGVRWTGACGGPGVMREKGRVSDRDMHASMRTDEGSDETSGGSGVAVDCEDGKCRR